MTGAGPQFAHEPAYGQLGVTRSPLARLLHALNQPLTGLQCLLELATAGPRRTEEYIRTLGECLQLTCRMSLLVGALREVVELQQPGSENPEPFLLDALLREAAGDLLPVAEAKGIHLRFESRGPLLVRANRSQLEAVIFRFLDSALSLTQEGSDFEVVARVEACKACLLVSWKYGAIPGSPPFSREELGLLIAQAGWEVAGAEWTQTRMEGVQTCLVRLPLALPQQESEK